uniref:ELYS beta-propeller domain-containing protein n=1 Tax=Globodera rostochiensis TaxID=31243 RepID=A0A914GTR3_GLORO
MSIRNIPEVLKQKLVEVEGTSKTTSPQTSVKENLAIQSSESPFIENGRFLLWKGVETGFFYLAGHPSPGSLAVYDYKNGTANAVLHFSHQFGRTALIVDAIYFPLSADHPGIVVAVTDRSVDKHGDYLAYFSLISRSLLNAFYLQYPITSICAILDGSAERAQFLRLSSSFHKDWPHILLVGCRYGYVSLVYLDLQDERLSAAIVPNASSPSTLLTNKNDELLPVRCKKNVHLTKIFYEDQMFVFRADDGTTKCLAKEKVVVSALHWVEKCGLAVIGFNFGGVMVVSLRTSKVYSLLYIEGIVQHFAFQEPEEDPRPILFFWIAFNSPRSGTSLLLCNMNFPKDEERTKLSADGGEEYTYLDPQFAPCMKWPLDNCTRLITMRTIHMQKGTSNGSGADSDRFLDASYSREFVLKPKTDTSLLFVTWSELLQHGEKRLHGALFDLNAFYAKRLIPKIQPDSTVARQIPFISRFSSQKLPSLHQTLLDIMPNVVYRFSPLAFLNESIDQLYYPSTYHLKNNTLTSARVFQTEVQPVQVQLIDELSQNFVNYFENPTQCVAWIHAVGLANSAPSANINEERVCLLRVVMHSFFPGIVSLIETSSDSIELLKFTQKWIWRELEITKAKFDDLCSPLFANPPHELSPNSQGFFTLRLRSWTTRIGFGPLLCMKQLSASRLYAIVTEQFARRVQKSKIRRKLQIHKLVGQIIDLNKQDEIWQGKTAEWYPPRDFTSLLPILLFVNITETAKTELIGYYCLDLEAAAATFGSSVEVKDGSTPPSYSFFSFFLSVLSEENLSSEEMDRVKVLWSEDKLLAEANPETENMLVSSADRISRQTSPNRADILQLREEFLKMDWGLYKFNELMLERGHFDLLLEMTSLKGDEPDFVQKCHGRCLDVKRRFPTLFRKRKALPLSIIEKFREKVVRRNDCRHLLPSQEYEPVDQCQLVLPINKFCAASFLPIKMATPEVNSQTFDVRRSENAAELYEELPLTIATPKRKEQRVFFGELTTPNANCTVNIEPFEEQPETPGATPLAMTPRPKEKRSPVVCKIIQKESVKAKDWDRIVKITQTPLSLRKSIGDTSKLPLRQQRSFERARTVLFPTDTAQQTGNKIVTRAVAKKMDRNGFDERASTLTQSRLCEFDQNEQERQHSPLPNMDNAVQPPSILKSDRKRSRLPTDSLSCKPRLRFAQALFTTEHIPSRAEKAMDQDTSFSNFASLSGSESSPASSSKVVGT